jgi:hypothetical protein
MARLQAGRMKVEAPKEPRFPAKTMTAGEVAARIFGGTALVLGLAAAYFVWPAGIIDVALGAITFGQLLRIFAAAAIALATIGLTAMLWD